MEKIKFRPLGQVRNIIEKMGLDVSHMHEDLVFVEHSAFLLRFDDTKETNLFIHFNTDCFADEAAKLLSSLEKYTKEEGFTLTKSSDFSLSQVEGKDEIRIEFLQEQK